MVERVVRVSPERAWAAWTEPDHLRRWYAPAPGVISQCEIDLRPGGVFRFVPRQPDGVENPVTCCYLEVVPYRRLVWTDALLPGYRPAPTGFFTLPPCRVVDTRNATGPSGGPALVATQTRTLPIAGSCGIPASAVAVSANLTAIGSAAGVISLFPGNALPLGTSNVNFGAGQTRAGNSVLMLATDGTGTLGVLNSSSTATQFLIDVNGYFQ